jgi:hypothetical protein
MKLFVATPAYGGQVNVHYTTSLLALQQFLYDKGIHMRYFTIGFDSLVPRARNVCAMEFLKSDCTHMIFIDADIVFKPMYVYDMMMSDTDLLCGIYAKKALDFDAIQKHSGTSLNMKGLTEKCARYNVNLMKNGMMNNPKPGIIEVMYAPTGFMLINKIALQSFVTDHKELEYKNDIRGYGFGDSCYDIFKCGVLNGRYMSEDYYFCHIWKESGRKVFVDLRPNLAHIGNFTYYGNPLLWLSSQ